jgi:hypothetical protein
MNRSFVRAGLAFSMLAFLAACRAMPQTPSGPSVNVAASTIVAVTFQAATLAAQARGSAAPPLIEATPTFDKPRLYINTDVKCRSGIGADFKVLASLPAGVTVDMVGKDSAAPAWLVQVPNSALTCWVRAQDSSPGGSFQNLPEVTPQPGSGKVPAPPSNLYWPFYCSYVDGVLYKITTNLAWSDAANDANGFRVYRQDTLVADLPANVMQYTDTGNVVLGTDLTYSVEAYNDAGASPRLSHTIASACK